MLNIDIFSQIYRYFVYTHRGVVLRISRTWDTSVQHPKSHKWKNRDIIQQDKSISETVDLFSLSEYAVQCRRIFATCWNIKTKTRNWAENRHWRKRKVKWHNKFVFHSQTVFWDTYHGSPLLNSVVSLALAVYILADKPKNYPFFSANSGT